MMQRLALWGLRRYIGGPGRSWVFTAIAALGMRMVRATRGRRELIDVSKISTGDRLVIEQLPVSHKKQIKQLKAEKKADKRLSKAQKAKAKDSKRASKRQAKNAG